VSLEKTCICWSSGLGLLTLQYAKLVGPNPVKGFLYLLDDVANVQGMTTDEQFSLVNVIVRFAWMKDCPSGYAIGCEEGFGGFAIWWIFPLVEYGTHAISDASMCMMNLLHNLAV